MASKRRWVGVSIALVIILLIFGWRIGRKTSSDRCDYDGARIQPLYAVYFSFKDGTEKRFCSVVCASLSFSQLKDHIKEVIVVDEVSGNRINASLASFVESEMISVPHVKNRIHIFADREDSLRHLQQFKGRWVENPFKQ